ncbi:Lrp/AsnC family transcriptional regulator [Kribbella sandramycini]|uniref:DNA-binding Lrp family transcriptional regulator n=1 Tax=Kribbella sandramycini TaxID=60450 RepID=A0A7Y4L6D5_9ACTN|nr:Lrp/AsnC family transcriptional regulator [Kribbella sandramycini]MBB6570323.1 DNA-binding Lrp family transcriptional regulator [Kribbella sandramycini]NOL45187.1 Lrp/AsnC family transcriptional regulator [Kribbella sandramycini]
MRSTIGIQSDSEPKNLPKQVLQSGALDSVDEQLLARLAGDGRATNSELSQAAGIAPSTAHGRVRSLLDRGVIAGFHAAVDQSAIGNGLQAMIGVTLRAGLRQESLSQFTRSIRGLPQVVQLFFVGGTDDFLLHVAVPDSSELRRFVVDHLSGERSVASTRTSVIFEYHRNVVAAAFE